MPIAPSVFTIDLMPQSRHRSIAYSGEKPIDFLQGVHSQVHFQLFSEIGGGFDWYTCPSIDNR